MGLYAIDCPSCGKPFMWFSGNLPEQRCDACIKKTEKPKENTVDLKALERFVKSKERFILQKIGSKRKNSAVGVGQYEVGDFSILEYPVNEEFPVPQFGAYIAGNGFHHLRTSPIVKIVSFDDTSTTFETEGGVYKLSIYSGQVPS
jgi:hypothetical protein